jgi:group I intron endonuclease
MKQSGIYLIFNSVSNIGYIGQSVNIMIRWYKHTYGLNKNKHHCEHLQRSWNKYGKDCFSLTILEETTENLTQAEQFWFDYFKFLSIPLYNSCPTAGKSMLGFKHSQKTIEKMKASQKGIPKPHKGIPRSEESRKKTGAGNIGRSCSETTKQRLREAHTGKQHALGFKHTDETRKRMSDGQKLRQQKLKSN